jgi:4-hydroxybenzoate polyprenyltransferase
VNWDRVPFLKGLSIRLSYALLGMAAGLAAGQTLGPPTFWQYAFLLVAGFGLLLVATLSDKDDEV